MAFSTACYATKTDAMLLSLPSSHQPLKLIFAIPSDNTIEHDGERVMLTGLDAGRPVEPSLVRDFPERAGLVFTFSSARSFKVR